MGRTNDRTVKRLYTSAVIKTFLITALTLLTPIAFSSCGQPAVNHYYSSCVMIQDKLFLAEAVMNYNELPENAEQIGIIESFWGTLPRKNGETNCLDMDEGSPIYQVSKQPKTLYVYNEYENKYFKCVQCDICLVSEEMFYVYDPRAAWKDENSLPEGYTPAGEVEKALSEALPQNDMEALGLPEGAAVYNKLELEGGQHYIYVQLENEGRYRYRRLSPLVDLSVD